MAYTFYKAVTDNGGAKGTEIASGQVNALFNTLTSQERLAGINKFRKMYIESDATETVYVGISAGGDYGDVLFASSGDAEVVGDLTGTEDRFGSAVIVSSTTTEIRVTKRAWVLFRVGEYIIYAGEFSQIASVADQGDGTTIITLSSALTAPPTEGSEITSAIELSLTANTPQSIWRENIYPTGVVAVNSTNTVTLIFVS